MKRINYIKPVDNLPDTFAKDENSNNYKLLQINLITTEGLRKDLVNISNALDINNAVGTVLEHLYGGRLYLKRGASSDEQYRVLLMNKVMQNTSDGTHKKLLDALAYVLRCDKSDIRITGSETSNTVIVKNIPLETLYRAEFTSEQVLTLIENLLPVGVRVSEYGFTGTFEFGNAEEYAPLTGFADIDRTMGGYLGMYGG